MIKTAIVCTWGIVAAGYALADAKDVLVKRLFVAMNCKQVHEQSMEAIYNRPASIPEGVLLDEHPAYENAHRQMTAMYRSKLSWEALEPSITRIYKVRFTSEELLAMAEFYETPVGKSIAAKSPEISRLCTAVSASEIRKLMPEYQKRLTDELTQVYLRRQNNPTTQPPAK